MGQVKPGCAGGDSGIPLPGPPASHDAWGGPGGVVVVGVRGGDTDTGGHRDTCATYLHLLHLVGHVVQAQVIGQRGGVQPVPVGQEELGASVRFPAAAGGAAFQGREVGDEAGATVGGEAGRVLALPVGPSALLLAGGRRRRLVEGVDGEGVPEVGVGVAGLGIRQRLVRGGEVRGLEVGGTRVGERRSRAVQVLADRREVREPRVPVAAPIVPVLERTEGWGEKAGGRQWRGGRVLGHRRQARLRGGGGRGCGRWHSLAPGERRGERRRSRPAPAQGACFFYGVSPKKSAPLPGKRLQTGSRRSPQRDYNTLTLTLVQVGGRIIKIRRIQLGHAAQSLPRSPGRGGDSEAARGDKGPGGWGPACPWRQGARTEQAGGPRYPPTSRGAARDGTRSSRPTAAGAAGEGRRFSLPAVPSPFLPLFPISAVKA